MKCKHCGEFLSGGSAPPRPVTNSGVAAVLSFFVPGLGQMYKGAIGAGFAFLILTTVGYLLLIVPGIALHLWAIIDAYNTPSPAVRSLKSMHSGASDAAKNVPPPKPPWHQHPYSHYAGYVLVALTVVLYVFMLAAI